MNSFRLTEEEKKEILGQHNKMKIMMEQTNTVTTPSSPVASDTPAAVATPEVATNPKPFDDTPAPMPDAPTNRVDIIKAIQQKLKDHYKMNLGKSGVDGKYGPNTASAIAKALKTNPSQRTGGVEVQSQIQPAGIIQPKAAPTPTASTTIQQPVK